MATLQSIKNSYNAALVTLNTAKVTNATHTGDVTGATALTIATDAVDIAMLSASGTASADTFLRGDNSWAAAGSPAASCAFRVKKSSTQTSNQNAYNTITWETEIFDEGDDFDFSNNRFEAPNAGTYWFHFQIATSFVFQGIEELAAISGTNSSGGGAYTVAFRQDEPINDSNARARAQGWYMSLTGLVVCAVGDRIFCSFRSEADTKTITDGNGTYFEGYQLI